MNPHIQNLKEEIKACAARARELREQVCEYAYQYSRASFTQRHEPYHGLLETRAELRDLVQRERYLAYGYLRGRTYNQIERTCRTRPNERLVAELARAPGEEISRWIEAGDQRRLWPTPAPAKQEVA